MLSMKHETIALQHWRASAKGAKRLNTPKLRVPNEEPIVPAPHAIATEMIGSSDRWRRRHLLSEMFDAAIKSALPEHCVPCNLPKPPKGRTVVVGAGKAAAAMAKAVEDHWPTSVSGVVVTRYGHAAACRSVEVIEAAHPIPDEAGVRAGSRIIKTVSDAAEDDLVICLISGGGSALLTAPPPGVTLDDERTLVEALLRSGATIREMNCVRKHVSMIKGGRLAALSAAPIVTLAISDVPGDDPATIASGPTIADPTTREEAIAILHRRGVEIPTPIQAWLDDPRSETPKPDQLGLGDFRLIATPQLMLEAAAAVADAAGYTPLILGDALEGEARDVGTAHADIVHQILADGLPVQPPCAVLSGGETTVTLHNGSGRGGRNAEFLLSLLIGLNAAHGVSAIAADTDGIDGTENNAGAFIDDHSLERADARGLIARDWLRRHDAYGFFQALGDLVHTGPTLTNVNDFRAVIIDGPTKCQEHSL